MTGRLWAPCQGGNTVRMNQQTDRNMVMHGAPFRRVSNADGARACLWQMQSLDGMFDRFADRRHEPSNANARDAETPRLYVVASL